MITDSTKVLAPKFSNRYSAGQCEPVVVWVKQPSGELMLAPHTNAKPFPGWTRVEYNTVREIEAFSRRFAAQELQKVKDQKIEAHLRHAQRRNMMRASAKLRIAQGYSKADVEMNKKLLENMDRSEKNFFDFIASDVSTHNSALEIERGETSKKRYTLVGDQKKVSLE